MSTHPNTEPDYTIRMPGTVAWQDLNIDPILATHEEILNHAPTINGDHKWIRFTSSLPAPYQHKPKGEPSLREKLKTRCTEWNRAYYKSQVETSVSYEVLSHSLQQRLHAVYADILQRNGAIDLRSINFDDTPGLFLSSQFWETLIFNMGSPGQDGLNHFKYSTYEIKKKFEFVHIDADSNSSSLAYAPTRMQILKVFLAGVHPATRSSGTTSLEPFALVQCHHAAVENHGYETRYAFVGPQQIVCSKSLDTLLCKQRHELLSKMIDESL